MISLPLSYYHELFGDYIETDKNSSLCSDKSLEYKSDLTNAGNNVTKM